ncbi:alcohol dehydrogenase catalytic domain-containing protein [Herbiconiux sp. KACC 21604]|uniref:zinc-binding dehydrogenase n=1 Tax=unclassified Herbiconiux TaxID=2618217 RepID=UPI00149290DF|nr:alcohol dehydrogenase catalytic domain-containing protein [Herbiconiux sp. SALV-R1]QJU53888.1 alcohol dehydrogenase catalytic domain-containing protein [Herbiconiux sp. SALV-R1]WPO84904.1 alcohol dehydrogenase catalytic domain-containing protein [Herbiconiux sp. KACC 21604]
MRALLYNDAYSVTMSDVPDPVIEASTDAIVRVVATCVCGSDLWYYRGQSERPPGSRIGHEFIGVVEEVGTDVGRVAVGDFVVSPFMYSDGSCVHCVNGITSSCVHGGFFAAKGVDGGQGQFVRVPLADGTLVVVPGGQPADELLPHLLALSDVYGTGFHAATTAGVRPGDVVAVVGDGAVGLSGVLAASRLGASRIIALSRNPARQAIATAFGATDLVEARGADAVAEVVELTGGVGVDATLECVGTAESFTTAFALARPGSRVGIVGMPHDVEFPLGIAFRNNVGLGGGLAPARAYLPPLLTEVLEGSVEPGRVFDYEVAFENLAEGYAAMDERRAVKAYARVS